MEKSTSKPQKSTSEPKSRSKFAVYLEKLIDENGGNKAAISRNSGVDRTSIQKQLSGERKLNYKSAQKLATYLNLTVDQRKEYFLLYDYQAKGDDGEAIYENRQAVSELLNDLATVKFSPLLPPECRKSLFPQSFNLWRIRH